jgi:hypothetical protein
VSASQPDVDGHGPGLVRARVSRLPVPNELRDPDCMDGPGHLRRRRLRRWAPWAVRPQEPRDCCFHPSSIDWRWVCSTAVDLVRQAGTAGITEGAAISDYATDIVHASSLPRDEQTAINVLLLGAGCGIQLSDPDAAWRYQDRQHRVATQIDQGVPYTVTQRLQLLDPATGLPTGDRDRSPGRHNLAADRRAQRQTARPGGIMAARRTVITRSCLDGCPSESPGLHP